MKARSGVLGLALLALCTNRALAQSVVSRTQGDGEQNQIAVDLIDGELVYDGKLKEDDVAKIVSLYRLSIVKPETLVIRSTGGSTFAGLMLGRFILSTQLSVRIVDYCGSACANYVFTAGKNKSINTGSVLWWHGAMASKSWEIPGTTERYTCKSDDTCGAELAAITKEKYRCKSPATCARETVEVTQFFAKDLDPLRKNEREFFELVGVDPTLTTYGNDVVSCGCVWTFSADDLRRFRVKNVSVEKGRSLEQTAESKKTLKEAKEKVVTLAVK